MKCPRCNSEEYRWHNKALGRVYCAECGKYYYFREESDDQEVLPITQLPDINIPKNLPDIITSIDTSKYLESKRITLQPDELELLDDYREGKVRSVEVEIYNEETYQYEWFKHSRIWRRLPKYKNILVVGDLHSPFIKKGYLEHCIMMYKKYKCNHVIFIGDIIDNHYSSFHPTDPDGYAAGEELDRAIDILAPWHEAFPNADVVLGNHDRIILRKVFAEGISKRWIRKFSDVLNTPTWTFVKNIEYDGTLYTHGIKGGSVNGAMTKAIKRGKSIVQGHWHTHSYVRWHITDTQRLYAMQVGCGVDEDAYAMAYADDPMSRWVISAGVVLENGTLPIVEPMNLGTKSLI